MADLPLQLSRQLCGTMAVHYKLLAESESYRQRCAQFENRALAYERGMRAPARVGVVTIPVVVHVVHNPASPAENISKAQIDSQIDVLNQDFRATNPDRVGVPSVWTNLIADCEIEFKLAETDPDGNPTDGVTRTATNKTAFVADDNDVKSSATGGADAWPSWRLPQYLGMRRSARRVRPADPRLRAVPRRPAGNRRCRHREPLLRHHRHRTRSVPSRTDRDARGRPLAEPAPHLGRRR